MSRAKGTRRETLPKRRRVREKIAAETDEQIMQRIDNVMKDQTKYDDWLTSRVETVVRNWPKC